MIEDLVARVFATRNAAHLAHWKTHSFAQHSALGAFYDDVIENIDKLIEAHQGAFDLIGKVDVQPVSEKDMVALLEDDMLFIGKNRVALCRKLPALDNILQELEGTYLTALYKLRNLK